MRLVTCQYDRKQRLGIVEGDMVKLLPMEERQPNDMIELIQGGSALLSSAVAASEESVSLSEVELLAPIPRPLKNIICLGLNYADHARESFEALGREVVLPEHPVVFTKAPTTVIGPYAEIQIVPSFSVQVDWEVELAFIIGRGGRNISVEESLQHVFGYTVINDVSARDVQNQHKQFFLGKSMDTSCPMGPWIVTADEIEDPQLLNLRTWVNGELKQDSNTREHIFDVARTISILSKGMTLEPGDVISTGTPAGVGFARTPPEFLQPGDVVECEVEGIGRLRNGVV